MRAAVRRAKIGPAESEDRSLCIGEIRLDPDRRTVYKKGIGIHVTPKEFELLYVLMLHSGNPVAHNQLLSSVWGAEYVGQMEYLRTFIHQLRRKLEDDPAHPEYIVTDSWFGYRFR